jgi:hypothetical protein
VQLVEDPLEWKLQTELVSSIRENYSVHENPLPVGTIVEKIAVWIKLVNRHPDVWMLQVRLTDAFTRKTRMAELIRVWSGAVKLKWLNSEYH